MNAGKPSAADGGLGNLPRTGRVAAALVLLCLLSQIPYAGAESLALEASADRPYWTVWRKERGLDQYESQVDVAFAGDGRVGWTVGRRGLILVTGDGGRHWTAQESGTSRDLFAIHASGDARRAWAVGSGGTILTTDDGGHHWTARESGVDVSLRSVHATTDSRGVWAVGDRGVIVFSPDGGETWSAQSSGVAGGLLGIHVGAGGRRAWAVGRDGNILATGDGGDRWTARDSGVGVDLHSVHAVRDSRRVWAAGEDGVILFSRDRGLTWEKQRSGVYADLNAIRMSADGRRGWAAGRGGVLVSTGDGETWTLRTSGTSRSLLGLHLSDDGRLGWIAGDDGVLLASEDGEAWAHRRVPLDLGTRLYAVHRSDDGLHGWVAGQNGTIAATVDGGKTWAAQPSGTCADLYGLHVAGDARHGWAVGEAGTVLATTDGGRTWRRQFNVTAEPFHAVRMARDGRRGWAAGRCGTILVTADGGVSWREADTETDVTLRDVHVSDDGRWGWAVGDDGTMLASSDGGESWVRRPSVTDRDLLSADFTPDGRRGWAVGDRGTILATADGGRTWDLRPGPTDEDLFSADFTPDGRRGWAVGDEGRIIATADGGRTWSLRPSPTDEDLMSVDFVTDGRRGWAVGDDGTILATVDGGRTWERQDSPTDRHLGAVYFLGDGRRGWIAGGVDLEVLSTVDGGANWVRVIAHREGPPEFFPAAMHMAADGRRGWIAGRGTIVTTDDGWTTWTERPGRAMFDLYAVDGGTDNRGVWAVGTDETILATIDGGETWTSQDPAEDGRATLRSIQVSSDGRRGWAVGRSGTIWARLDGGERWSRQDSGFPDRDLRGIHIAADGRRGWAAGDVGSVLATTDGGERWALQDSDSTGEADFNAIDFAADGLHGWAVGDDGVVLATGNGGKHWVSQPIDFEDDLEAMDVAGAGGSIGVWAVGRDASVFRLERANGTPYLAAFDATAAPNGDVLVEFTARDEEGDSIDVVAVEMCTRPRERRLCEPLDLAGLARDRDRWSLRWDPDSTTEYEVESGDLLQFAVELRDDASEFTFNHKTARSWEYRTWYMDLWLRYPHAVLGGLAGVVVVLAYLALLLGVFLLNPAVLVRGHLVASSRGEAGSILQVPARLLQLLLRAIALSYLANHPRTRRAWARRYLQDRASIGDLAPEVRARYLQAGDVLDAWVRKHVEVARRALLERDTVRKRALFVDMPVALESDGGSSLALTRAEIAAMVRTVFRSRRGAVGICGPGGSGKTTIAAQIARWSCSEDPEDWVFGHRTIPVWIDSETTDLVKDVDGELRALVAPEELEDDIVHALLVNQRLLVIVDGLSERARKTQEHVHGIYRTRVPPNALILTGRVEPDIEALPIIRPQLIDEATIVPFIQQYVNLAHVRSGLRGRAQLAIAGRALDIVEARGQRVPMTPLLVCMFVDSAVDASTRNEAQLPPGELVNSVPELIVEYLFRMNPQGRDTPNRLDDRFMIRVAKAVSRTLLEPDFLPKELRDKEVNPTVEKVRREYLGTEGATAPDTESIVRRLVDNDIVEERLRGGTRFLRVRLDPVAEYLAAIDWAEDAGPDDSKWEALLERLADPDFKGDGFLLALFDVVSTYGEDFAIPARVGRRLESLITEAGGSDG